ncbi:MAG: HAD family phosphatase [Clostridiaceae bacterium]|jgi:putative hydrolase of the HAD superfamily|nr:HAD family phosphatase [Clostridiaceae bacterium]
MISNIMFDLGRVLLTYEPREYLINLYTDPVKADCLYQAVFGNPVWLELDRGVVSEEDAYERMVEVAPYPEEIYYLLQHWDEMLSPIHQVVQIAERLKENNYSLYILSNFHKKAYEKIYKKFRFFKLFDGILISAYTGFIKPDLAIYRKILTEYSISPEGTLFIDDTAENIAGAEKAGITGLLFHDGAQLERDLYRLGILSP